MIYLIFIFIFISILFMNNKQYGDDNWYGSAVIGTCTNIEKPYLRLTSVSLKIDILKIK